MCNGPMPILRRLQKPLEAILKVKKGEGKLSRKTAKQNDACRSEQAKQEVALEKMLSIRHLFFPFSKSWKICGQRCDVG
ncbi:hypothetical protein GOP47_0013246 [Adiantum capillus-veneris]|uniref:Uncharacterized protein n=1 Tax=Adiantum capillus-veneris TaxID=13818 RepID=A0A9D4UN46_ADICA|nr:hypothetical protein GOP47_0013246 [Adiantum capillus-veneris]